MSLARRAADLARRWGTPAHPPRLVTHRENAVFDLTLADGRRLPLRLHRAGYQSAEGIAAELAWTEALAALGLRCPAPLRTAAGALTVTDDEGTASAVAWIDGTPLSELDLAPGPMAEAMHDVGALLARMHAAADRSAALPPCLRPAWHRGGLAGPDPLWGRYWEDAHGPDGPALKAARDRAAAWLTAFAPGADIGPIHADPLLENVLRDDGGALWLIDFDDCGMGYRLYDPGAALVQLWARPDAAALTDAMAAGYAAARGLDADAVAQALPRFTAIRALASAGWIATRAPDGDPRRAAYARRALDLSERYL